MIYNIESYDRLFTVNNEPLLVLVSQKVASDIIRDTSNVIIEELIGAEDLAGDIGDLSCKSVILPSISG